MDALPDIINWLSANWGTGIVVAALLALLAKLGNANREKTIEYGIKLGGGVLWIFKKRRAFVFIVSDYTQHRVIPFVSKWYRTVDWMVYGVWLACEKEGAVSAYKKPVNSDQPEKIGAVANGQDNKSSS